MMTYRLIKGIVKESSDVNVPLNVPSRILINKEGYAVSVHRISNNSGTDLWNRDDQRSTRYVMLTD